jgi:hypothetical protein
MIGTVIRPKLEIVGFALIGVHSRLRIFRKANQL